MDFQIVRPNNFCNRLIVVDGLPGCGKTMLSAVISSLERVELFKYSYEIETQCILHHFGKVDRHTTASMIQYHLDLIVYNQMMGRETNFRFSDLSSAFKAVDRIKYFKRLFGPGDEAVPSLIENQKPIIHLVTHCLSAYAKPLLDNFKSEMVLINFHRNPLYMLKQNMWNMQNLIGSERDFVLYYRWKGKRLPYFFYTQEEKMLKANPIENAIYFLQWSRKNALKNKHNDFSKFYYELTFESFVSNPFPHLEQIESRLCTRKTKFTSGILKREKIPRELLSEGRDMPIYRRVNWEKTTAASTNQEINDLYKWAISEISDEAKEALDWLLEDYGKIVNRLENK